MHWLDYLPLFGAAPLFLFIITPWTLAISILLATMAVLRTKSLTPAQRLPSQLALISIPFSVVLLLLTAHPTVPEPASCFICPSKAQEAIFLGFGAVQAVFLFVWSSVWLAIAWRNKRTIGVVRPVVLVLLGLGCLAYLKLAVPLPAVPFTDGFTHPEQ